MTQDIVQQSTRNIRLTISFDGTAYNGWQRQKHAATIQGEIEKCLAIMTTSTVTLHGAGRTDAGVHAEEMTAHFTTTAPISCQAFVKGLNSMLPEAIRIFAAKEMPSDFHARFNAVAKRYHYAICTSQIMPPQQRLYTLHVPYSLDFAKMQTCLDLVVGRHDFSSFENQGSRDKDKPSRKGAVRTITRAELHSHNQHNHNFVFVGEGFLRHMVRNMVGTILEVGRGQMSVSAFHAALLAKDRSQGGPTAPPHGLTLKKVYYQGDIPETPSRSGE